MTTPRFDQDPATDYGKCVTCGIDLPTEQEADDHRRQTIEGGRSHRTRSSNPSRKDRIEREVSDAIDDAIHSALSTIDSLIARDHITEEEAETAIRAQYIDLSDAWKEYSE